MEDGGSSQKMKKFLSSDKEDSLKHLIENPNEII